MAGNASLYMLRSVGLRICFLLSDVTWSAGYHPKCSTIEPHVCHMAVNQNPVLSWAPPHPLLHAPLSRPVVAYLCHECLAQVCPTKEACCKGACRKPADSVTNLCRGMAAQACHKPSVFDSQPHNCLFAKLSEDLLQGDCTTLPGFVSCRRMAV